MRIDLQIENASFDQIPPIVPVEGLAPMGAARAIHLGTFLGGVASDLAKMLAEKGGLPMVTMAVLASGQAIAIPCSATPAAKDAVAEAIGSMCRCAPVIAVVVICEAFVVKVDETRPGDAEEEHASIVERMRTEGSLANHHSRREMFMASVQCRLRGIPWCTDYTAEMIRDESDRVRLGPGLVRRIEGGGSGRFFDMAESLTDICAEVLA